MYSRGVAWSKDMPWTTVLDDFHFDLDDIAAAYRSAALEPSLSFDARLRLGRIRSWQGKSEEALELWRQVRTQTEAASLRYMTHVFSGHTLMNLNRTGEAVVEFRSALRIFPNMQSAAVPLASLLYLTDERQGAGAIIATLLAGSSGATGDPWADYLAPGYQYWPEFRQKIREGIRKDASRNGDDTVGEQPWLRRTEAARFSDSR
jgi:tetratricopeptide (TPR) repeat protein